MNLPIKVSFFGSEGSQLDQTAMCHIVSFTYHAEIQTGTFVLSEGHCTDMHGAIKIFTRIDPDVRFIVDGNTIWARKHRGRWESFRVKNPETFEQKFLHNVTAIRDRAIANELHEADVCEVAFVVLLGQELNLTGDTRKLLELVQQSKGDAA